MWHEFMAVRIRKAGEKLTLELHFEEGLDLNMWKGGRDLQVDITSWAKAQYKESTGAKLGGTHL